ncbi:MAG: rhodanese-like domain-containing protein [Burkholderiales bacterium]|nr:rhodanese-like domain-containing protein [Burkholderiales bacterium]
MKRHDLFDVAAARALAEGLPFAGALTPREAHQLASEGAAKIVDIRTRPEWEFVGHIEDTPLIEWKSYGSSRPNPDFVDKLAARFAHDEAILLICRSGIRSRDAATAAAQAGFTRVYNVLEGFEGDQDEEGRRGNLGGWRHAGLPWTQH